MQNRNEKAMASVIILMYRNSEFLEHALDSCYMQNYELMEIIVSDDGTSDYDEEYVYSLCKKKLMTKVKNVLIRHSETNEGTVKNFNHAIKLSKGEVIIPLACDDYFITESSVSYIMDFFKQNNVLLATARQLHINCNGKSVILPHILDERLLLSGDGYRIWLSISAFPCFIGGSVTYYRKELFEKMGYFDESYILLEDWPKYLKIIENKEQIGFIKHIIIKHTSGGVSASENGRRNCKLIEDDIACMEHVLDYNGWENIPLYHKRLLQYRKDSLKQERDNGGIYIAAKYFDIIVLRVLRKIARLLWKLIDNRKGAE